MKTYNIEIRELHSYRGSLPLCRGVGSFYAAWKRYCAGREFYDREEAVKALADAWWDCAYELASDRVAAAHPEFDDEPTPSCEWETAMDQEYQKGLADIRETGYAEYDDGECRIVESDEDND